MLLLPPCAQQIRGAASTTTPVKWSAKGSGFSKEHDEVRLKWREQIERGWLQPTLPSASLNALERAFEQLAEMPESGHKRENRRVCAAPSVTRR